MRFVTSLSLEDKQMVVLVFEDDNGMQVAYGVDPEQDPELVRWVFICEVTNLGGFLKALVDDDEQGFRTNSLELPTRPPPSPWPKLRDVISYAHTIHADEALAFIRASHAA
jgi:hypothetical protein